MHIKRWLIIVFDWAAHRTHIHTNALQSKKGTLLSQWNVWLAATLIWFDYETLPFIIKINYFPLNCNEKHFKNPLFFNEREGTFSVFDFNEVKVTCLSGKSIWQLCNDIFLIRPLNAGFMRLWYRKKGWRRFWRKLNFNTSITFKMLKDFFFFVLVWK